MTPRKQRKQRKARKVKVWAIQLASGRLLREPDAFRKSSTPMLFSSRDVASGYCSVRGDKPVRVTITLEKQK